MPSIADPLSMIWNFRGTPHTAKLLPPRGRILSPEYVTSLLVGLRISVLGDFMEVFTGRMLVSDPLSNLNVSDSPHTDNVSNHSLQFLLALSDTAPMNRSVNSSPCSCLVHHPRFFILVFVHINCIDRHILLLPAPTHLREVSDTPAIYAIVWCLVVSTPHCGGGVS